MRSILLLFIILQVGFKANAQSFTNLGRTWVKGYCYKTDGTKVNGYIDENDYYSDHILIRASEDSSKVKIMRTELKSFVADVDSFTVSTDKLITYKVLVNNATKLYSITKKKLITPIGGVVSLIGGGAHSTSYYFGEDPGSVTIINRKNFKTIMTKIMTDKPLVIDKIKDKTYELAEMEDLISFYKTGIMPDHEEVESSSE